VSDDPSVPSADARRAFARKPVRIPVTVISSQRRKTDVANGKASDLSEGGMGVVVSSDLTLHQPIWIEFRTPPYNQPVQMRGVVRHSSEGRYGVQFQSASRDQIEHIQRIIADA
jgi:c-di-GMP-binding flagellar brake protein YcgR